jgi:hypothetical protein
MSVLCAVLVLFELMSDLKVNFHKSMLVGVNISESWLLEAATALRCKVGKIPFLYLGLPIGGDQRRLGFWEPVLARIRNRLSGWKSRFLSFGGRLVLLKSVLTSLPVYALSFFKAPAGVWKVGCETAQGVQHCPSGQMVLEDPVRSGGIVVSSVGGSLWVGAGPVEGGREDRVSVVEGDCEDPGWSGRAWRWLVWGVCDEEGGGWDRNLFLDRPLAGRDPFVRAFWAVV